MTVKREWAIARAWLYEKLTGAATPPPAPHTPRRTASD
jgi:hypothetical protein